MELKYLFLFVIVSLLSCRPNDSTVPQSKTEAIPATEADLGSLYQYYHAEPRTQEERDENQLIAYAADRGYAPRRTTSGVYVSTQENGKGATLKWGDPVRVMYKGYFLTGKVFDSSYKKGKALAFRVGEMIPGWSEALIGSRKGDKLTVLIPSHMGYGKRGFGKVIPPDSNLAFDIHILDAQ